MVFLFHFATAHSPKGFFLGENDLLRTALAVLTAGHIGVDLFFLLSGFLIYHSSTSKGLGAAEFMERRYRRLVPAYMFSIVLVEAIRMGGDPAGWTVAAVLLAVYVAARAVRAVARLEQSAYRAYWAMTAALFTAAALLTLFWRSSTLDAPALPRYLLNLGLNAVFLQYYFVDYVSINFVTWTQAVEFLFYFGFAVYLRCRRGPRATAVALLLIALPLALYLFQGPIAAILRGHGFALAPMERFTAFLVGVGLAKLYENVQLWKLFTRFAAPLAMPGLLLIPAVQYAWVARVSESRDQVELDLFYGVVSLLGFFVMVGALTPRGAVHRIFNWAPLRALGAISYSFYLVHFSVIATFYYLLRPYSLPEMVLHLAASLTATVAVSSISFCLLERPYFVERARRAATSTRPAATMLGASAELPSPTM